MLRESNSPFLEQLKADEHLYLFSQRSIVKFFEKLGARYIAFEPAIFAHYDMFFAVSRIPIVTHGTDEVESGLLATPNGRIALALLDIRDREMDLVRKWESSEADRAARWKQIEALTSSLTESELDRTARGQQIEALSTMLSESESDRAARGEQIETLSTMLSESESDRAARGEQIETLSAMLNESEIDRTARWEQIKSLSVLLEGSEASRIVCEEQIKSLKIKLEDLLKRQENLPK
jgi:hypothetical protein